MAKYRLTANGFMDTEKGGHFRADMENSHYRDYLEWVADGNTPDPVVPPTPLTDEQELADSDKYMIRAVDWLLEHLIADGVVKLNNLPADLKTLYLQRKTQRGA